MWSISCLVNTVKIPSECSKELFDIAHELWDDSDAVTDENGHLYFNPDHMEHMDYLAIYDDIVNILKKHWVKGDVCFGSLEGDNAGSFWGYRFDGRGGMKKLSGTIQWREGGTGILEGKTKGK